MANQVGPSVIGAQSCFTGRVDTTPPTALFPVATNVLRNPADNSVVILLVSDTINLGNLVGQVLTLCGTVEIVSGLRILRVTGVLSPEAAVSPPAPGPSPVEVNRFLAQLIAQIRANPALLRDPRVIATLRAYGVQLPF